MRGDLFKLRVALGLCGYCGEERGNDGTTTLCRPCANIEGDRSKKCKVNRIKEGKCGACGKPRGVDGTRVRCRECANKCLRRITTLFASRVAAGLCKICGLRPPKKGSRKCAECVAYTTDCKQEKTSMRKALGLCQWCGLREPAPELQGCRICLDGRNAAMRK